MKEVKHDIEMAIQVDRPKNKQQASYHVFTSGHVQNAVATQPKIVPLKLSFHVLLT